MNKLLVKPLITLLSATSNPAVAAPIVNLSRRNMGYCFGTYKDTPKENVTMRQDGKEKQQGFHPEKSQKNEDQFRKDASILNEKTGNKEPTDFGKQGANFQEVNKQKESTQYGSHQKDHQK